MRLAQETEAFGAPEDHSWLGSRHATDTGEGITLEDSEWITIFTDGIIPSGVVVARRTSDGLGIPYVDVTNESIVVTRTATGGTVDITLDGETAAAVPVVAATTAAELLAALETLSNVNAGDVTVTGAAGGPFTITFVAGDYAGENAPDLVIDDTNATGGTVLAAVTDGGVEDPAGEGVPVGHLFTTRDIGDGTGNTGASYLWHGQVVESNLPTNHGLTARAKSLLPHFHYVD